MQNSIVLCAEKPHSLKNDKAPIKKQRSKVKQNVKAGEKKTAPKPEQRRKSRTPHNSSGQSTCSSSSSFQRICSRKHQNSNNLVRLRIEENVRVSNSFSEKRASIKDPSYVQKLPMHKKTSSKPKKNKSRGRIHTQRAPFQRQFREGKVTGTFRRRVTTAATHPQFLSAAPPR